MILAPAGSGLIVRMAAPPYATLLPLPVARGPARLPRAAVLVLDADPSADAALLPAAVDEARHRFPAAPVVVRVPALTLAAIRLAQRAGRLRIRAVVDAAEPLAEALHPVLTRPDDLGDDVVEWHTLAGTPVPAALVPLVRGIVDEAHRYPQLGELLARLGECERTARHRFRSRGVPPPTAWHQMARALHAALRVQADTGMRLSMLAMDLGFSDHSGFSRQLTRAFGVSPAAVQGTLGWEWLLARWLPRDRGRDSSGNNLSLQALSVSERVC